MKSTKFAWTDTEIEYLKSNYKYMRNRELAKALNKSDSTVYKKSKRLKLTGRVEENLSKIVSSRFSTWTKYDIDFLENNMLLISVAEMAKALNKATHLVFKKIAQLGYDYKNNNKFSKVYLDLNDFAKEVCYSVSSVKYWIRLGKIEATKFKNKYWIHKSELKKIKGQ